MPLSKSAEELNELKCSGGPLGVICVTDLQMLASSRFEVADADVDADVDVDVDVDTDAAPEFPEANWVDGCVPEFCGLLLLFTVSGTTRFCLA